MHRIQKGLTGIGALILMMGVATAVSANGNLAPPLERTGAPSELNCSECHLGTAVNGGGGSILVAGPGAYEPGETYELEVFLTDPSASRWGFELTALTAAGDEPVGTLVATESQTQVGESSNLGREYLSHSAAKSGSQSAAWLFEWIAPPQDAGDVIFHAAGVAGNSNFNFIGDHVYTGSTTVESVPEPGSALALWTVLASLAVLRRKVL